MLLITELNEELQYTTEESVDETTGAKRKNLFIEGVFLQAGVVNRNQRIYPPEILAGEVKRYVNERIAKGQGYGELGHPSGPMINLERVSHMTQSLRQEGNDFIGKARIADTPYGNIAKGLMESGAKLGVSSRGLGSIKPNQMGIMEVQKDFRLAAAADIVADPSAPNAFVNGIMEGVEFHMNGDHETWKKIEAVKAEVRNTSRANLEEAAIRLFTKFMKSL